MFSHADLSLAVASLPSEAEPDHAPWIEIDSFSWGTATSGNSGAQGQTGSTGKATIQDFQVTIKTCTASPQLMQTCATGDPIKEIKLTLVKVDNGDKPIEYITWNMENVYISSYQFGGSGDGPTQSFSFNFMAIEWTYRPDNGGAARGEQPADGGQQSPQDAPRFDFGLDLENTAPAPGPPQFDFGQDLDNAPPIPGPPVFDFGQDLDSTPPAPGGPRFDFGQDLENPQITAVPQVQVFAGVMSTDSRSFFAFGASFSGGVYVAAGDVNGDGVPDIIIGSGADRTSLVTALLGDVAARGNAVCASFVPYLTRGESDDTHGNSVDNDDAEVVICSIGDAADHWIPDMLAANNGSNDVTVLFGQGGDTTWILTAGPSLNARASSVSASSSRNGTLEDLNVASHQFSTNLSDGPTESAYQNTFVCYPSDVSFRAPRVTPKPVVQGTETAIVVCPFGEEIVTDENGRVKVQFHWNREDKNDADSSCWVRVASLGAGKQWGVISTPRINDEVVIDFVEGDPDQPIIIGTVYNAEQMTPYALPSDQTQSGIKTNSSLDGTQANRNELRFDDQQGSDELCIQAAKN